MELLSKELENKNLYERMRMKDAMQELGEEIDELEKDFKEIRFILYYFHI